MELKDLLKEKKFEPKKNKRGGIHSEVQSLAAELSEYFNEKEKIGAYLRIVKRNGVDKARRIWAEVKESGRRNNNVSEVKLFFWKIKQ